MKIRSVIIGFVALMALTGITSAVIAAGPSVPAWVNPDGTVDQSKLPSEIDLLDCQGNVVGRRSNPFADNAPAYVPPAAAARNGHPSCERGGGAVVEGFSGDPLDSP
jgi:hypothetical protein